MQRIALDRLVTGGSASQFDFVTNDNCCILKLRLNVSWNRKNRRDFGRTVSRRRDCWVLCVEWNHDYMRIRALCDRHRYFVTRIIKNVSALCYRRDKKKKNRGRERRTHDAAYFISRADVAAVFCVDQHNESSLVY